jgi:hypothetical protein
MSALPPELADPLEELRAKLLEINDSEQTCMTNVVASAPHGKSFSEVQAVMAKCRQASAAAATTAINAFRHKCSEITAQTNSLATAAGHFCYRQKHLGLLGQVGELRSCLRL